MRKTHTRITVLPITPTEQPTTPTRRLYARGAPVRNLRLTDDLWHQITNEATRTGQTASDVIRAAITAHLPTTTPQPDPTTTPPRTSHSRHPPESGTIDHVAAEVSLPPGRRPQDEHHP